MRRRHDARMLDQLQRDLVLGRLLLVHIDGGTAALARLQSGEQIALVNDAAARHIDDLDATPALGQRLGGDKVCVVGWRELMEYLVGAKPPKKKTAEKPPLTARLRNQRRVHRDVVGQRPDLLQLQLLDAGRLRLLGGGDGIETDDAHAPGAHAAADLLADAAQAQDGQRLAVQLAARVQFAVPAALAHALASRHDRTGQRADQQAGELAGGDRIAAGRAKK